MHIALYRLGAIGLPISKLFGPDAIQYRLENSSAKAILMESETVGKLDGVRDAIATLQARDRLRRQGGRSPAARRWTASTSTIY